ncbi:MAG TPA: type II secretion system protein [Pirellulales bacterium]|nr:type II secretion system protein [Pirellulales bacterium]
MLRPQAFGRHGRKCFPAPSVSGVSVEAGPYLPDAGRKFLSMEMRVPQRCVARGMTLVELLVVITITGLLVACSCIA